MIRVCALANRINGPHLEHYLDLERSVIRAGLRFHMTVDARPWLWQNKLDWEWDMVRAYPKDNFVFIDAFDFLFVGDADELETLLRRQPLLFSSDAGQHPWPYIHYASAYLKRRPELSKWKWVNGSGPAGSGEAIAEAIEYGKLHYRFDERGTDQSFWSNVYLDGYGELDQACELTQAFYYAEDGDFGTHGGRFVNRQTGAKPQFLHATGRSWHMIPEELYPPRKETKP